jgi:hypothetical protein
MERSIEQIKDEIKVKKDKLRQSALEQDSLRKQIFYHEVEINNIKRKSELIRLFEERNSQGKLNQDRIEQLHDLFVRIGHNRTLNIRLNLSPIFFRESDDTPDFVKEKINHLFFLKDLNGNLRFAGCSDWFGATYPFKPTFEEQQLLDDFGLKVGNMFNWTHSKF